ncbi:hypothetical protein BDA96_03G188200 [Sorghum bicolor]|uniref:Uncharacterized protein n=1 Tax=Sorghum bicolor TaxID=4558 RepID=A0A921UMR5_SORBI|nr:hypothetical protein BDA96_03G188200 [Sorghum bicolor]
MAAALLRVSEGMGERGRTALPPSTLFCPLLYPLHLPQLFPTWTTTTVPDATGAWRRRSTWSSISSSTLLPLPASSSVSPSLPLSLSLPPSLLMRRRARREGAPTSAGAPPLVGPDPPISPPSYIRAP